MINKKLQNKGELFYNYKYYIILEMSYMIHTFGARSKGRRARSKEQRA